MTLYVRSLYKLFLLVLFDILSVYSFSQGLRFISNNNLIANRTSYSVFENEPQVFKKYLEIDFDLSIINPSSFGYILYIRDNDNNLYYNLTYTSENDSISYLKMSVKSKMIFLSVPLNKKNLGSRKWQKILLRFDTENDSVFLKINETESKAHIDSPVTRIKPEIFFGKHDSFIDVPEMAIRNLHIKSCNKDYKFLFNEIDGNIVHDSKGASLGWVENPVWLIKESYYWKKIKQFSTDKVSTVNFNPRSQQFIIVNKDSLIRFNVANNQTERVRLTEPVPVPMRLGVSFIDQRFNKLYVYEVNDVAIGKPTIASLNLDSLTWNQCTQDQFTEQKHHHIGLLNEDKNEYIIFGGYGNRKYLNSFLAFHLKGNYWEQLSFKGDFIEPRFFCGATMRNTDELLIYGGIGNPSGDQSAGKLYYHDCYLVNLNNKTIKKLWDAKEAPEQEVSDRNMIMSKDLNYFYTLCYPEYFPNTFLKLYRFSIDNGEYEILGDSIPMNSEEITTNANLYLNKSTDEIYCTTQEFEINGSSKITIYALSNPPISKKAFFNEPKNKNKFLANSVLLISIIITLTLISFYLINTFYLKRKKINQIRSKLQKEISKTVPEKKPRANAVSLFGDFIVYDRNGREISYLFSPKVKELFLMILLNSQDKKVTSSEIYSVFWPDKTVEKAKNSKGVTLNLLRKIIADIDGIEIKYENKFLSFETDERFYCDFIEFQQLINRFQKGVIDDNEITKELIAIVSTGRFLSFTEFEYFDKFKQEFETNVLKIIPYQIHTNFKNRDYSQVILLARIIYNIDYLNEAAFHYELISYIKTDMADQAKKRYTSYIIDYKKELGDDYPYTFRELIMHKSLEFIKENSYLFD